MTSTDENLDVRNGWPEFDLTGSPLDGINLIEASAGTGKTYTIAALVLRLVVEHRVPINEILVVTFTEAATAELKARIRLRLRQALDLVMGRGDEDKFLQSVIDGLDHPEQAVDLLQAAIRDFDESAIFTIHGFCMRMLHENAFESGTRFDVELEQDPTVLYQEIVEDFWRKHLYTASPLFVNYALKTLKLSSLMTLAGNRIIRHHLRIIPKLEVEDTTDLEGRFQKVFQSMYDLWQNEKDRIASMLMEDPGLKRNKYSKKYLPSWIEQLNQFMASGGRDPILPKQISKFTTSIINNSVKKGYGPPTHPFFDRCDQLVTIHNELIQSFDDRIIALKTSLFRYIGQEVEIRKQQRNVQTFDDLLLDLHHALNRDGGDKLAEKIARRFKAALIDEFQDTDGIQYAIFQSIFGREGSENRLFFIGDPKQAIYGFRGADIFTYMNAARHASSRYTLKTNYRSESELVNAVNAIFSNSPHAFVYPEIAYRKVEAAGIDDSLTIDSKASLPNGMESPEQMQIWLIPPIQDDNSKTVLNKDDARKQIVATVASEIARLIQLGRKELVMIGNRPVQESDIAVLVFRNWEARLIQKALSANHVPAVLHGTDNLFETPEAAEMERLLLGIANPGNESRIRSALVTRMLGKTGDALFALSQDESQWEHVLIQFRHYHDIWVSRGFMRMFRELMHQENIGPRLMALPDGERCLTNVLHLAELLHDTDCRKRAGIHYLIKWLSRMRDSRTSGQDEHLLRLESDENAVKLVTVHKSKGLEYPIVYCPFLWNNFLVDDKERMLLFHDEANQMQPTLDLGSSEFQSHLLYAQKQRLAENLRLLYVALTRARNRCHVVWGPVRGAESSALAWLLHPVKPMQDSVNALPSQVEMPKEMDQIQADLDRLCKRSKSTIGVYPMPTPQSWLQDTDRQVGPVDLEARQFGGIIQSGITFTSFSAMAKTQKEPSMLDTVMDLGYRDMEVHEDAAILDLPTMTLDGTQESTFFDFPRGTGPGTCLHEILEYLDFTETDPDKVKSLIIEKLDAHHIDPQWVDPVWAAMDHVLNTPLDPMDSDFKLSRISRHNRIDEMDFHFSIQSLTSETLQKIFSMPSAPGAPFNYVEHIGKLDFQMQQGFMKGFIDLVFRYQGRYYVVDWKSNWLGPRYEDYHGQRIIEAMVEHHYLLQYAIYLVALNKYLSQRVPDYEYNRHFGGVFYLFLRGMSVDHGSEFGIYRDRPSTQFVEALTDALTG